MLGQSNTVFWKPSKTVSERLEMGWNYNKINNYSRLKNLAFISDSIPEKHIFDSIMKGETRVRLTDELVINKLSFSSKQLASYQFISDFYKELLSPFVYGHDYTAYNNREVYIISIETLKTLCVIANTTSSWDFRDKITQIEKFSLDCFINQNQRNNYIENSERAVKIHDILKEASMA